MDKRSQSLNKPSYLKQFDPAIQKHHETLNNKLKDKAMLTSKPISKDCYDSIKESVTFLILQLLQEHQNELKCIRSAIQAGRLDIVMKELNKVIGDK